MRLSLALLALAGTLCAVHPAEARRAHRVDLAPVPVAGAMVDDRYPHMRIPEAYGTARAGRGERAVQRAHHRHKHRRQAVRTKAQPAPLVRVPLPTPRPVQAPSEERTSEPQTSLAGGFVSEVSRATSQIVGGRPAGCPRKFCGCGASLHLFGRIIPRLNLAANWLAFPRAVPAPNMVAARRGHVFVLKRHIAGKTWLVFDANSGGNRTRIHPRSIAGFVIVNPRG